MEPQRSKAFAWLAASSALLVLLASGVAITRLGDDEGDTRVASAPTTQPATGAEGGDIGGAGSGQSDSSPSGRSNSAASGPAAGASDANATTDSSPLGGASGLAANGGARSAGVRAAAGQRTPGSTGLQGSGETDGGADSTQSAGDPQGSTQAGQPPGGDPNGQPQGGAGGTDGTGQDGDGSSGEPPAPSQQPPEQDSRLVGASASAGEGAQGGVVGVAVDGTSLDVDLTLGRDQLVGNHPPSDGTGVSFGGRLLNPPSASPAFHTLPG